MSTPSVTCGNDQRSGFGIRRSGRLFDFVTASFDFGAARSSRARGRPGPWAVAWSSRARFGRVSGGESVGALLGERGAVGGL
ncbi:hypothetical protein [Streptomyces sp. NRRL S-813]|uniref:hypothetical protein n=1 Tax=Streptomyces sp. NRRL S-813 TaxID=1463919 RepID=UPI00131C84FA|nr:hypothetical protein [Streptomyces sp. NRRL S-813]